MFDRFVAALLVISLTACSSLPRSVPPGPLAGGQTVAGLEIQPGDNAAEDPDAEAKPELDCGILRSIRRSKASGPRNRLRP